MLKYIQVRRVKYHSSSLFDFTLRRKYFLYHSVSNFCLACRNGRQVTEEEGKGRSSDHILSSFSNPLHLSERFYTCQRSRNIRESPGYGTDLPLSRTGHHGRFPFNPKVRKFRFVHQMERTILVWSDRNIRDHL